MSARDWAIDILGGTARGSEIVCDCLFCGKEGHMYVNGRTGLAYCFVCGAGANLAQLIAELEGVDEDYARVKAERILDGEQDAHTTDATLAAAYIKLLRGRAIDDTNTPVQIKLPRTCVPITHARACKAREYLHARGFTQAHWDRYTPVYCTDATDDERRYKHHIVFSNTNEHGVLNFFTTRAAYEPKNYPKSYHPGGAKRGGILFGEFALRDAVKQGRAPLFIVEGPLDMLALSGYAVALTGKFMSEEQAVSAAKYRHIVVALDAGETRDTVRACKLLRGLGVLGVRMCGTYPHGAKDPGDMSRLGPSSAARALYASSVLSTRNTDLRFGLRAAR